VRGDTHAGCGERSGETGPWQHRHRAPDRLNTRNVGRLISVLDSRHLTDRFQFSSPSLEPNGEAIAGPCARRGVS